MNKPVSVVERLNGWVALVVVLLLPLVGYGAVMALGVFSNDIKQWLPRGFEESEKYEWFVDAFGLDEMAVVSWEGCSADDPRLSRVATDLRLLRTDTGEPVFSRVTTGAEVVAQIENLGWSHAQAQKRVTGLFVGVDGVTTCLVLVPNASLIRNRSLIVGHIVRTVTASTGIPESLLRMGGPTVDGAAIDRESKLALRQFLWMTLLVVFGLTWYRKRSFRLALIIMAVAGYCAAVSLALLYYSGGTMNLTMIMLPTLTLILGVSAAIHMVNYFLKSLAAGGRIEAGTGRSAGLRAIRAGGYPVFLSSATTAVGMASLATSQIGPIRSFGLYSAAAVMISLPVVVNALMWILDHRTHWLSDRHLGHMVDDGQEPTPGPLVLWLSRQTYRYSTAIVAGSLLLVAGTGWFIQNLEASVKIQNRFARSSRIIQDYLWMEEKLGPLVPMEVVVRFPADHALDAWDRMNRVGRIELRLRENPAVNASWSAATLRPPWPARNLSGMRREIAQRTVRNEWAASLDRVAAAGLIAEEDGQQLWRISLRIHAMNNIDYGDLLDEITTALDGQIGELNAALEARGQQPVSTLITGAIPMMYKAQHQVFRDLAISFCTAFGLIALTLMVVLRSFAAGLLAMLPNIFPPLLIFGLMGFWGTRIEIGSVMTASIALGISVDDTIHFLAWYRRAQSRTGSRWLGVQKAYAYCARSMIDTTLVCGLGVAPFMLSSFMPTVQFARLMLALLVVALIGDLVLLPAMLNGRLGWFFQGRRRPWDRGTRPEGPEKPLQPLPEQLRAGPIEGAAKKPDSPPLLQPRLPVSGKKRRGVAN